MMTGLVHESSRRQTQVHVLRSRLANSLSLAIDIPFPNLTSPSLSVTRLTCPLCRPNSLDSSSTRCIPPSRRASPSSLSCSFPSTQSRRSSIRSSCHSRSTSNSPRYAHSSWRSFRSFEFNQQDVRFAVQAGGRLVRSKAESHQWSTQSWTWRCQG